MMIDMIILFPILGTFILIAIIFLYSNIENEENE
jgi:hypothetical protein